MSKKINFLQELCDFDDKPIEDMNKRESPVKRGPTLTLGAACIYVLGYAKNTADDKEFDVEAVNRYYGLAALIKMSMREKKPLELDSETITLLKALLKKQNVPVVSGQCFLLLEGKKPYTPPAAPVPAADLVTDGEESNA